VPSVCYRRLLSRQRLPIISASLRRSFARNGKDSIDRSHQPGYVEVEVLPGVYLNRIAVPEITKRRWQFFFTRHPSAQPLRTDDGEHDITVAQGSVDVPPKIDSDGDAVDIAKDRFTPIPRDKSVENSTGRDARVIPAVRNRYPGHCCSEQHELRELIKAYSPETARSRDRPFQYDRCAVVARCLRIASLGACLAGNAITRQDNRRNIPRL
jgi:hypothetical protein